MNRARIVGVRLTPKEVDRLEQLQKKLHCRKLSDVLRRALADLSFSEGVTESDNIVKQRTSVKQPFPLTELRNRAAKKKGTKPRKKAG